MTTATQQQALPPVWELKRSDPRYYRALRLDRKARGVCTHCSKPSIPGKTKCESCSHNVRRSQEKAHLRAKHRQYVKQRYKQRKNEGVCPVCGRERDKILLVHCYQCRKRHREAAREFTRRNHERSLEAARRYRERNREALREKARQRYWAQKRKVAG